MNLSTLHHPSGGELIFDRISGVLSYDQQDKIEKFFLSNEFPWYHHLNTVDPTSQESKLFDDFGFHTHNFLLKGKLKSPLFQEAINLIELGQFMKEYNISPNLYVSFFFFIRMFCMFKYNKFIAIKKIFYNLFFIIFSSENFLLFLSNK